jgi:mono/diheme cytochrome c family protein
VTEIPEHLLKRAQQRRAALAGGEDATEDAPAAAAPAEGGDAPAAAAVAKAPAAKGPAPLPTLEEEVVPAKPDLLVVTAAKRRQKIPFYGAAVLALLPLWAFLYFYAVKPPPAGSNDAIAVGKSVYTGNCAGCHLGTGDGAKGGGVGQQLSGGHVNATFADPLDMVHWISYGADDGARPDGTYGDKKRAGGAMNVNTLSGKMPAFGTALTPEEIAAVTIYVREELSGGDPKDDPKFNTETFAADPEAAAEIVQEVIDLKAGGDPDTKSIDASESGSK